ncbi:MAG: hypothetical protein ACFE0J_26295 [Elainellaceae cyanobacterium]
MLFSKVLPKVKDPDSAKNFAVLTVLALVALAFALPYLLSWIFTLFPKETPEWAKPLVVTGVAILLSWDMVDSIVSSAIKAAKNQEISEYLEQKPNIAKIERQQGLEYCCVIPETSRSFTSVADGGPSPTICKRRKGRDAVTRGLAYNEKVLEKVAETATSLTLVQLGKDKTTSKNDFKNFLNDIYAYSYLAPGNLNFNSLLLQQGTFSFDIG